MTEQEVIKYIEHHAYISDEVKEMAIKALKKQIPKETQGMKKNICPMCFSYNEIFPKRARTVKKDIVYCWHCGQAIDLGE